MEEWMWERWHFTQFITMFSFLSLLLKLSPDTVCAAGHTAPSNCHKRREVSPLRWPVEDTLCFKVCLMRINTFSNWGSITAITLTVMIFIYSIDFKFLFVLLVFFVNHNGEGFVWCEWENVLITQIQGRHLNSFLWNRLRFATDPYNVRGIWPQSSPASDTTPLSPGRGCHRNGRLMRKLD